ncbi:hypothetical protein [Rhodalgimonas zhirmunskyi]|uniref:Uncharacterized protein n=1 Tax=Rhodalgimonas zhirmunskyi TaxID=2964767 RepID=A0AAJ1U8N2_9RHOB|nr:hypothetical protein [Rhodoalgimonas zhirmunskyi]MDQ2093825.1 hypothetical protein [Rhodoalgimonas zhirmunskyi]
MKTLVLIAALLAGLLTGLLAGPVRADVAGFENDYRALFTSHAGRVQQPAPGMRVLEMPGPVIIYEDTASDGTRHYRAEDHSGRGAAGCMFDALIDATVIAGLCPDMLDATSSAQLDAMTRAMARFVAANAAPPLPVRAVEPRLRSVVRERAARIRVRCPAPVSGVQDNRARLQAMLRPGGIGALKRALAMPRLPVMQPCD